MPESEMAIALGRPEAIAAAASDPDLVAFLRRSLADTKHSRTLAQAPGTQALFDRRIRAIEGVLTAVGGEEEVARGE